MQFLSKNRSLIGFGGCILVAVGCFLPWASAAGISLSWVSGDGKIVIVLAIVSAILMYLKKDKFSLISTILAALIFLYDGSKLFSINSNLGIGFIAILIGLIAMGIYPFLNKNQN